MTIRLADCLRAWGTPTFNDMLRQEIEHLDSHELPLYQGLSAGNHVLEDGWSAMVISVSESAGGTLRAKVGIFYRSVLAGCSCAEDPSPVDALNEYCELCFEIDKSTGVATATLWEP